MTTEEIRDISVEQVSDSEGPEEGSNSLIDSATQDKYRVWKKNTPYLYDYISTNSLLWPSLSVQFFPDAETHEGSETEPWTTLQQRLLVGTFTLGQGKDTLSVYRHSYYPSLNSRHLDVSSLTYNGDKEEFELGTVSRKKLHLTQSINHLGDVNRAKYMPQNPDVIASANNLGDLVVYDRTKHASFQSALTGELVAAPELRLVSGATSDRSVDIFALDWNPQKEGTVVSATTHGHVSMFDLRREITSKDTTVVNECFHYNNEQVGINDVQWLPSHNALFVCGDDQGRIQLIDTRSDSQIVKSHQIVSREGINSVSVCPGNSLFLATGDATGNIDIWDLRALGNNSSTYSIKAHGQSITQLKWHPKFQDCLGSSSTEGSVKIYSLNNYDNGNLGLQFTHQGHMLGVNDFDWSLHDDWMVASVSDDNSMHIWKPAVQYRAQ